MSSLPNVALKGWFKAGVVLAGYVVAILAASAAVALRIATTSGPDAQASSGMYAFGDGLLFLGVFGVIALVPTGAALYFLRPYPRFWSVASAVALGIAATGLAAFTLYAIASRWPAGSNVAMWAALAVLRLLVAPLLAGFFVLSAVVAPGRPSRPRFFVAAAVEVLVSLFAILHWFRPLPFL